MAWRLLPFFGRKEEKEVVNNLEKHVDLIVETVDGLKNVVNAFCEEDFDRMDELIEEVSSKEKIADDLRREIESRLHEGAFLPASRENLHRLVERVDEIADTAEAAVKMFQIREKSFHSMCLVFSEKCVEISQELKDKLLLLVESVVKVVDTLKVSIHLLNVDMKEASLKAREVDLREEESDEIEHQTLKYLFHAEGELDVLSIIQLREIISLIGDVADKAEDASDIVSTIAVRHGA